MVVLGAFVLVLLAVVLLAAGLTALMVAFDPVDIHLLLAGLIGIAAGATCVHLFADLVRHGGA